MTTYSNVFEMPYRPASAKPKNDVRHLRGNDLKYMAISSVYISNAMSYIENIDCICDVEHLVCMRCELLDRLKAVKEDLIDMIE